MNKLFSEENKVPRTLKARKVAGSATRKQSKYEIALSYKVHLFIQSWKQRE